MSDDKYKVFDGDRGFVDARSSGFKHTLRTSPLDKPKVTKSGEVVEPAPRKRKP